MKLDFNTIRVNTENFMAARLNKEATISQFIDVQKSYQLF